MGIKEEVIESSFGIILYRVNFDKIICNRTDFQNPRKLGTGDVKDIKRYGTAISIVEKMKKYQWVFTVENVLVCTNYAEKIETVLVDVRIDENVDILNSMHYMNNIRYGSDFNVEIHGLVDNPVLLKHSLFCVFK